MRKLPQAHHTTAKTAYKNKQAALKLNHLENVKAQSNAGAEKLGNSHIHVNTGNTDEAQLKNEQTEHRQRQTKVGRLSGTVA